MCSLTSGGTTTQTTALPSWAQADIQNGAGGPLTTVAGMQFSPYPGSLQAPFDGNVATGENMLAQTGSFTAPTVTSPTVSAGTLPQTNLSGYLNPYTSSVVNATNNQIGLQLDQQQQANDGSAAMAGAFGGDRAGIVNAQTAFNADQLMAQTDAGLNQANFTNAQGMATQDLNRQLAAAGENLQGSLTAQGENLQGALSANQQRMAAGQGLYGMGMGVTQADQAGLNSFVNQYFTGQNYPATMAQLEAQMVGQDSGALGADRTVTTVAPNASTLGTVAGLGTTLAGLGGLLGGSSSSGLGGLLGLAGSGANYVSNQLGLGNIFGSSSSAASSAGSTAGVDAANQASDDVALGVTPTSQTTFYGSGTSGVGGATDGFGGLFDFADGGLVPSSGTPFIQGGSPLAFADGGLVDDPGYTPALSADTYDGAVTPTQEQLMLYDYTTPSRMLAAPQPSSVSSGGGTGSSTSQDMASLGLLGLPSTGSYASGGDVVGVDPDGVPFYGVDANGMPIYDQADAAAAGAAATSAPAAAAPAVNPVPPGGSAPGQAVATGGDQVNPVPPPVAAPTGLAAAAPPAPVSMPPASSGDGGAPAAAAPTSAPPADDGVAPTGSIAGDIVGGDVPPPPSGGIAGAVLTSDGSGLAGAPPAAVATASPDRIDRSADPASPLPPGQNAPPGYASAPPPAAAPAAAPASQSLLGGGGNGWALPVLAAGLGMLSNASPNAAKMIGGGLAGVQTLMQQREAQLRGQQLQNQMDYQRGILGVRQGQMAVQQQRADQTGAYQEGQLGIRQQQADTAQQRTDQTGSYQQGQLGIRQQQADQTGAFQQGQLGVRQQQADIAGQRAGTAQQRADQTGAFQQQQIALRQQAFDAQQGNRAQQAQFRANDAEDRQARSLMFNASQSGKVMSYAQALQQVRATRAATGAAPLPGASPSATPNFSEGQTASGPNGQKIVFRNGGWQPMAQTE